MQWLHFEKKNSFKLYYKEVYNIDLPFQEMDFSKKKLRGRPTTSKILLPALYKKSSKNKIGKIQ